jgi:hypothetical protein
VALNIANSHAECTANVLIASTRDRISSINQFQLISSAESISAELR